MLKNYKGNPLDFSYSGLKTAVINYVHNKTEKGEEVIHADVACSFQQEAVGVLIERALKVVELTGYNVLTISGGVAANGYLRDSLTKAVENKNIKLVLPEKRYCTDNGAMIGAEGYLQYLKGNFSDLELNAKAVVKLD